MQIEIYAEEMVEITKRVDVSIDDLISELWARVGRLQENPKRFLIAGPVLDSVTKILASVPDQTIAELSPEGRAEMRKRLIAELERYTAGIVPAGN